MHHKIINQLLINYLQTETKRIPQKQKIKILKSRAKKLRIILNNKANLSSYLSNYFSIFVS